MYVIVLRVEVQTVKSAMSLVPHLPMKPTRVSMEEIVLWVQ
jgi:hypothetical protein